MSLVLITYAKGPQSDLYPTLIASNVVNTHASLDVSPIAIVYEVDLLVKSNKASTVGIQLEGEEPIYGAEAVLKKLFVAFPRILNGKNAELVCMLPCLRARAQVASGRGLQEDGKGGDVACQGPAAGRRRTGRL